MEDINKSRNIGINVTITPGVVEIYKNGMLTGNAKGGTAYGTRISFNEKNYVAKAKATIGSNVKTIIDGKEEELKEVNRDIGNRIEVIRNEEISPINIDLGTEYWGTDYAREKARGDFVKAGNKIDRVAEILNAAIKNDNKDIYLYYKDRIAAEEEIARMEREGIDLSIIDKEQAKKIIERAAGGEVDDVQIISSKDPNIKEIIGAEGIRGRAYYTGKGKVVIVADNVEDYAKAIGVIGKEGRHFYHRGNGMEDTEDYSTFYGRQLEKYYRKHFGDVDVAFVTEQLKYTKEQLGYDWENDAYWIESTHPGGHGALMIVNEKYPDGRVYSWSAIGPDHMHYGIEFKGIKNKLGIPYPKFEKINYGALYITNGKNYLLGKYGRHSGKIHKIEGSKEYDNKIVDFYVKFIEGKEKKEITEFNSKSKNEGIGSYYIYKGSERPYRLGAYNCVTVGLSSIYYANGLSLDEFRKNRKIGEKVTEFHTYFNPRSAVRTPVLKGKTYVIVEYKGDNKNGKHTKERENEIDRIMDKLRKDSGVKK